MKRPASRLSETVRRTQAGESAAAIAAALDVAPRTVQRMRTVAASAGALPRVSPSQQIPYQTKPCKACGNPYGPRLKNNGSLDWTGWRKSKCCSNDCKLKVARAARWRDLAWRSA